MDALRGAQNAAKTVVLEEGLQITPIGFPPEDAEFLNTRLTQHRLIYGAYGIPPHKVGDLERATFSNIEHSALEFIQDGGLPWLVNAEQEFSLQLIEEDDIFAEFVVDGYLRGDAKTRAEANAIRWQHASLSANEWRQRENENPVEGGDVFYAPVNYAPVGSPAPVTDEETEPAPTKSATSIKCPDCGHLLGKASPPYELRCRWCKKMVSEDAPAEADLAAPVKSEEAATNGHMPEIHVHLPQPTVKVEPQDLSSIEERMDELGAELAVVAQQASRKPKRFTAVRDEAKRLMEVVPVYDDD
jgi:hypothetical protein